MLGRALFVFIWLTIAASLVLSASPLDVQEAGLPDAVRTTALSNAAAESVDRASGDLAGAACSPGCPCVGLLVTVRTSPVVSSRLRATLLVWLLPPQTAPGPEPLPPKGSSI